MEFCKALMVVLNLMANAAILLRAKNVGLNLLI